MDDKEPAEALMPATVPERRRARKFPFSLLDAALRRAMDLAVSLVGLVLLSPLMALIAVRIRRMSPGPVLYRGLRAGRGGKNFKMLKFRTMFETPQSYQGLRVTAKGDPRITPFGGWLRSTKLNELPQLWNVLRGEMSLVGPRPEDPFLVKKWPQGVRQEILSVRPGITSPASVVYRDEENLLQSADVMNTYLIDILPSKLRLDLLYVRNRTLLSDVDVIFLTLVALLPRLGALAIPENLLFWGPLSRFTNRFFNWFILDFIIASLAIGISGIIWRFSAPLDV
ncbi:MAG: sugar transferase, partial [Anaerolineales bacterium]|nr:sugar transferase [Anaerolineales bacterium]